MQKIPLNEVKANLGLPEAAVFVGYVVYLIDSDEFVLDIKRGKASTKRIFVKTPEMAKVYVSFPLAVADALRCKQFASVALLFDLENQLIIALQE